MDRFNNPEAIAIVDLSYGQPGEGIYWKHVLQYCLDGNLQAVLDEYSHMLMEGYDYSKQDRQERNRVLTADMIRTLKTHTASYIVDTYQNFGDRVKNPHKTSRKARPMRMRSHYAVGFMTPEAKEQAFSGKKTSG